MSYKVKVKCRNCKWVGEVEISNRITVQDTVCPNCGNDYYLEVVEK